MKFPVFSIRDLRTGFMNPVIEMNEPSAVRNFEFAVRNSASLMNSHPGDYALYRIAEFDTESGEIFSCTPEFIVDAAAIL